MMVFQSVFYFPKKENVAINANTLDVESEKLIRIPGLVTKTTFDDLYSEKITKEEFFSLCKKLVKYKIPPNSEDFH